MPQPLTSRAPAATLIAFALALPLAAQQAGSQVPVQNKPLIGLIDKFLTRPLNEDLRAELIDSARSRADVDMTVAANLMPWTCYSDSSKQVEGFDMLLSAAYVAGNMKVQLVNGTKGDAPEAGLQAVIEVYDRLRAKIRNYFVPEVDDWKRRQKLGQLGLLADSLLQASDPDCSAPKPARFPRNTILHAVPDTAKRP